MFEKYEPSLTLGQHL